MKYPIGTNVIIWYHDKFKYGLIQNRHTVKRGVYTYDVRVEHGSMYIYVPVDEFKAQIFIDSEKTAKFVPQIISNLHGETTANVKVHETQTTSTTKIA